MNRLFINFLDWFERHLQPEKYKQIESFLLHYYPACTSSSPANGFTCKLYKTIDLVQALREHTGIEMHIRDCQKTLLRLGYRRVIIYENARDLSFGYNYWLIKNQTKEMLEDLADIKTIWESRNDERIPFDEYLKQQNE